LVERVHGKDEVTGSIPVVGSRRFQILTGSAIPASVSPIHPDMSQDNLIKLECTQCKHVGYQSHKNKKTLKERLELKKFCKWCRAHVAHKETK
jgi:large subunit ribosomal protein L33